MCRIRMLFYMVALIAFCGCGEKSTKGSESNNPLAGEAPKSTPIPPPDAFVISKSEYAVVERYLNESHFVFNHMREDFPGTPTGPKVTGILNGDVRFGSIRYKNLDTLNVDIEGGPPLELRPEDIAKMREWIGKYWEWKGTSEAQHLPEGVAKSLGTINHREFVFITPNTLQIGDTRFKEKQVNGLWLRLTRDLPLLRASALDRIKTASRQIEEEDAKRASYESQIRRNRSAVDSALK